MRRAAVVVLLAACGFAALSIFSLSRRSGGANAAAATAATKPQPPLGPALLPHANPFEAWPTPLTHAPCRPRIYVYDLPPALRPLGPNRPLADCFSAVPAAYRAEVVLPAKLRTAPFASLYATEDPAEATHFLVPFFGSCWLFAHCFGRGGATDSADNCGVDRRYVAPLLDHISAAFPWWNRSGGADHVVVHPMDRRLQYYGDPRLRRTLALVTNGDRRPASGFRALREIVIPSVTAPLARGGLRPEAIVGADGNPDDRPIRALFRGLFARSPEDSYSHGIRWLLSLKAQRPAGWVVGGKMRMAGNYGSDLRSARFGISPEGWTLDNTRTWDYLSFGVIPVLIADGIVLPFEDDVDWNSFSIRVRREDAHNLPAILEAVPPERMLQMHRRIWQGARFMLCEYDAWHYIARALCRLSGMHDPTVLPFNASSHSQMLWEIPSFQLLL